MVLAVSAANLDVRLIKSRTIVEDEELPRIELKLEIKRNSDGIIATDIWKDDYWFEEGNARCDCNRELFWLRAQGLLDGYKNTECGEDRYSLRLSNNSTGEILYNEIDETA